MRSRHFARKSSGHGLLSYIQYIQWRLWSLKLSTMKIGRKEIDFVSDFDKIKINYQDLQI